MAIRQLTESVNKQTESPLYKWPEDYSLWELGRFDNETGHCVARRKEKGSMDTELPYEKKLVVECESLKQR